jgi:hypothetical protein
MPTAWSNDDRGAGCFFGSGQIRCDRWIMYIGYIALAGTDVSLLGFRLACLRTRRAASPQRNRIQISGMYLLDTAPYQQKSPNQANQVGPAEGFKTGRLVAHGLGSGCKETSVRTANDSVNYNALDRKILQLVRQGFVARRYVRQTLW